MTNPMTPELEAAIEREPTPHPLREAVSALRMLALREEHSASHAIGCTHDKAVRDATKHHYQMIAFRVAAATIENLALENDSWPCRESKALARAYEKRRTTFPLPTKDD